MLDLEEELFALIEAFDSANVPYALCGGLAVAIHARPRATIDIDVLLPEADAERAKDAARSRGFKFEAAPMNFHGGKVPIRRVTKIDADGEVLMLDLLVVTAATADVWAARERHDWRGRSITVVSRDGLIALKRMRSSAQDLADIETLTEGVE